MLKAWRSVDCFTEFFKWLNRSNRTTALSSAQGAAGAYRLQPHRRQWTGCLENAGAFTSHNPVSLHGPL
jgi:hypothetical protein